MLLIPFPLPCLCFSSIWLFLSNMFLLFAKNGKTVLVILDGEEQVCYNIDKDLTINIASENNHTNTLVIKDGKASIDSADCPDKICVNHRSISKVGETIVCLPNKVVIEIKE